MSHHNNPFGPPPSSTVSTAANKYPDISNDPALSQYQGQYNQQQQYNPQQQQQQYSQPPQQVQPQQTGYNFQPQPLQPPQQHAPLLGAHSAYQQPQPTGYQQQQPQQYTHQQQQPQYGQQQQQYGQYPSNTPTQQASYHPDLDPYGNLGALQHTQQQQQQHTPQPNGAGQQGQVHPRQYVHDHKAGLTNWDAYEWKQLLNRLDALREAWEAHRATIVATAQSRPGSDPSALDYLKRESDSQIDSIHASKLQLSEVESGWRHSTDPASKARVREALNAGLTGLPEFPPAFNPASLGGSFAQSAYEDQRKHSILSGYAGGPSGLQAQPTGWQQPQPTGYQPPQQAGYQQAQPTGFQAQYQQPQQTGYQQGGFGGVGMVPQQTGYSMGQQGQYGYGQQHY